MSEEIKMAIIADKNAICRHIDNLCNDKMKELKKEQIELIKILFEHIVELAQREE